MQIYIYKTIKKKNTSNTCTLKCVVKINFYDNYGD